VLLLAGIIVMVVGVADFVIARLLIRSQAATTGGLGASDPPVVARILRRSGLVTLAIGAVLVVIGAMD
jgi:hypothetical protein